MALSEAFQNLIKTMESHAESLRKRQRGFITRVKHEELKREEDIQRTKIEFLKRGYNFHKSEVEPQKIIHKPDYKPGTNKHLKGYTAPTNGEIIEAMQDYAEVEQ